MLRVVILRAVLPGSGGTEVRGLRGLLMGQIERECWKLLNAARHTHVLLIDIAKSFGDALLDRPTVKKYRSVKRAALKLWILGFWQSVFPFVIAGVHYGSQL